MQRTTYRRSNALALDEPRRNARHAPYASRPPTDASIDDSIPWLSKGTTSEQVPAARTGNDGTPLSKARDAKTALTTRATKLLALGDITAARLLLERAANAQDAAAAFLLAQTYEPAVLGVHDTQSITPDPTTERDGYRRAASFGSAYAQQRLAHLQN